MNVAGPAAPVNGAAPARPRPAAAAAAVAKTVTDVDATLGRATKVIVNSAPGNDHVVLSTVEIDGSTLLRVGGLETIESMQLDPAHWSLTAQQAECVRSVTFDARTCLLSVMLAEPPPKFSCESDGCSSAGASGDGDDLSAAAAPAHRRQHHHHHTPQRPAEKPFYVVRMRMNGDVIEVVPDPAAGGPTGSVPDAPDVARAKSCLPLVGQTVASLASSVALEVGTLEFAAELGGAEPKRRYCNVRVGGIKLFDWRLLNPASWPRGAAVPGAIVANFFPHFDVASSELVIPVRPPERVEQMYRAIKKRAAAKAKTREGEGDAEDLEREGEDEDEDMREEVLPRKRKASADCDGIEEAAAVSAASRKRRKTVS